MKLTSRQRMARRMSRRLEPLRTKLCCWPFQWLDDRPEWLKCKEALDKVLLELHKESYPSLYPPQETP